MRDWSDAPSRRNRTSTRSPSVLVSSTDQPLAGVSETNVTVDEVTSSTTEPPGADNGTVRGAEGALVVGGDVGDDVAGGFEVGPTTIEAGGLLGAAVGTVTIPGVVGSIEVGTVRMVVDDVVGSVVVVVEVSAE